MDCMGELMPAQSTNLYSRLIARLRYFYGTRMASAEHRDTAGAIPVLAR